MTSSKTTTASESSPTFEFDTIFNELGEFGRYQAFVYVFICLAIFVHGPVTLSYVFTAGNLDYRCKISQCETATNTTTESEYNPHWLMNAVPFDGDGNPARCQRYSIHSTNYDESFNCFNSNYFIKNQTIDGCTDFIYRTDEVTILKEFNLNCEENDWKRTIVGSINNIGLFIGLPIMGFLADKFGRKNILIWGLFLCGIVGLIKSYATSYTMFLILECLDAALGSGTFVCGFVLGMELVGPSKRAIGGTFIMCCYAMGVAFLGTVASIVQDYHDLLRWTYAPALLVITYFWLIPESSRWLIVNNRSEEAEAILQRAAKTNRVTLSDQFVQNIRNIPSTRPDSIPSRSEQNELHKLIKSPTLVTRTLGCFFCWLINSYVTYGITLDSVSMGGSRYLNFILINAVEIPSYVFTHFMMARIGRRWSLSSLMVLGGLSCFGTVFIPQGGDYIIYRLALFVLGKFAIAASFNILYVYTTEIFPTSVRNGMLSTCSMVGRIGTVFSPQTSLLSRYMEALPAIIYSVTAIVSGVLVLQFPETFNTKLPDTIEEAEQIGTTPSSFCFKHNLHITSNTKIIKT